MNSRLSCRIFFKSAFLLTDDASATSICSSAAALSAAADRLAITCCSLILEFRHLQPAGLCARLSKSSERGFDQQSPTAQFEPWTSLPSLLPLLRFTQQPALCLLAELLPQAAFGSTQLHWSGTSTRLNPETATALLQKLHRHTPRFPWLILMHLWRNKCPHGFANMGG